MLFRKDQPTESTLTDKQQRLHQVSEQILSSLPMMYQTMGRSILAPQLSELTDDRIDEMILQFEQVIDFVKHGNREQ